MNYRNITLKIFYNMQDALYPNLSLWRTKTTRVDLIEIEFYD